ncbi:MAG: hypothetical protein H6581_24505 [Bacteroidia bacterium]|nr:hypothetical protein [Bacteroidia bacterium]
MKEYCFVIQPFDKAKFDKRFGDIFEPAIKNAGIFPYRVDRDPSVRIPIEEIESKIKDSRLCFAEITTNNPNVWYELGFAFACGKDVIMVCSDEREGGFPFDIQHKRIISYQTSSISDFESLGSSITERISSFLKVNKRVEKLNDTPVVPIEGLKSHEIALLLLVMENSLSNEDTVSLYRIKDEMQKSGYTDIATSIGIRALTAKKMVETFSEYDSYNQHEFIACRLLDQGEKWVLYFARAQVTLLKLWTC